MKFNKKNRESDMIKQMVRISTVSALFAVLATAGIYPPSSGDITVAVPFDFVVGTQTLRAGEYIVRNEAQNGTVQICEDGVYCVTVQTQGVQAGEEAPAQPQLVFRQHGNRQLLAQIWSPRHGVVQLAKAAHANQVASVGLVREICVNARELCIHTSKGITPTWH